jgi:hypothetical protein
MADTLTSEIKVSLGWLFQDSNSMGNVADGAQLNYHQAFADGTGDDQADKVWHDARILSAGANEDLVLSNLPLTLFDNIAGHRIGESEGNFVGECRDRRGRGPCAWRRCVARVAGSLCCGGR